jgi:hypothetical protein
VFRRRRESGYPTSSNRASSFHLQWVFPPDTPPLASVRVTLTVAEPPAVPDLYFWALQASFADRGRRFGGAHLGLQWYPPHPGSTAVNWGGYDPNGAILPGTESSLPSATGNDNTRDFAWEPGRPYELRIARGSQGWAGSVDGSAVRELLGGGNELTDVVMWSEVFARCDAPSVSVEWSDPRATTVDGLEVWPDAMRVNYQALRDGGCTNTNCSVRGPSFVQRTSCERDTPIGALLSAE